MAKQKKVRIGNNRSHESKIHRKLVKKLAKVQRRKNRS